MIRPSPQPDHRGEPRPGVADYGFAAPDADDDPTLSAETIGSSRTLCGYPRVCLQSNPDAGRRELAEPMGMTWQAP